MKSFIIIATMSVILAGCQTVLPQSAIDSQRPVPVEQRAKVVRIIKKSGIGIFDLPSIRDAKISDIMTIDRQNHVELFCVKFYSRVFNGKSGKRSVDDIPVVMNFIAGKDRADSMCLDPRIKYHPFLELENFKKS